MPKQRKKLTISNYDFVCALLYVIENGCKWRALPKEFGNWHTVYVRFNRWSKNGTIDRIFEELQNRNIIDIRTEIVCIDSTAVKATRMLPVRESQVEGRASVAQKGAHNKDSFGFRVCQIRVSFSSVARK